MSNGSAKHNQVNNDPVLFFDGVCGLCNFWVDLVMKVDRQELMRFSPLQSSFAEKRLPQPLREELSTLVLLVGEAIYTKSDAVLKIGPLIGGIWKISIVGYLMPKRVRDGLYDFVVRHRYQWFGKKETCRIPTSEERARFIL